MKVFSHDTAGGTALFKNLEDARNFNADDPDADLYSILDQVENYRKDGVFHIRICYEELNKPFPCNEWTQSSNFVEESEITDFEKIELTWKESGTGGAFGGLGRSPASSCCNLIDDLPDHGNWFFSIGTITNWGEGIPGPQPHSVNKVELYLAASMF